MPLTPAATFAPTSSAAESFARIIDALCRAVPTLIARDRSAGPLIMLIYARLRRLAARFAALAARVQAGTLPGARCSRGRRAASLRSPSVLPEGFGWLAGLVPDAAGFGAQLRHVLLTDPAMASLLAEAPQAGRYLRAVCWMAGVPLPEILRRGKAVPGVAGVCPLPVCGGARAGVRARVRAGQGGVTARAKPHAGVAEARVGIAPKPGRGCDSEPGFGTGRPGGQGLPGQMRRL